MINWKQLFCWHKWYYGTDDSQRNREFKFCFKCKKFKFTSPLIKKHGTKS